MTEDQGDTTARPAASDDARTGAAADAASAERVAGVRASAPGERAGGYDGDAAIHLEELVVEPMPAAERTHAIEGIPIELVGSHLRVSGSVVIGQHRRLSDFINHHEGLMELRDATVLRRNGDPTRVTAPSIWVSPDEVTLIGQQEERACGKSPASS